MKSLRWILGLVFALALLAPVAIPMAESQEPPDTELNAAQSDSINPSPTPTFTPTLADAVVSDEPTQASDLPTATTADLPTETATIDVPTETAIAELPTETAILELPTETATVESTVTETPSATATLADIGLVEISEHLTPECAPAPGKDLTDCTYDGEDLRAFDFSGTTLTNATFDGANISGVDFIGATYVGTTDDAPTFNGVTGPSADFTDAIIPGATFDGSKLECAIFDNADLTAATFDGSNLLNASFDGATLTAATWGPITTCPDGTTSGARAVAQSCVYMSHSVT